MSLKDSISRYLDLFPVGQSYLDAISRGREELDSRKAERKEGREARRENRQSGRNVAAKLENYWMDQGLRAIEDPNFGRKDQRELDQEALDASAALSARAASQAQELSRESMAAGGQERGNVQQAVGGLADRLADSFYQSRARLGEVDREAAIRTQNQAIQNAYVAAASAEQKRLKRKQEILSMLSAGIGSGADFLGGEEMAKLLTPGGET